MEITIKKLDKLKKSVHYQRYLKLVVDAGLSSSQLQAVDNFIDYIQGYGTVKNARKAKKVVDLIVAGMRDDITIVENDE